VTVSVTEGDPFVEARRVVEAAEARGLRLRATGGIAIGLICPNARVAPLARAYSDIDFIADSTCMDEVESLFIDFGYLPDADFNAFHGADRRFFRDVAHERDADVFINEVRGCHLLQVRERLDLTRLTITPADLLLSKLQVVETNEKDYQDIVALLVDFELTDDDSGISVARLTDVCASDWGWWRTVTMVAEGARGYLLRAEAEGHRFGLAAERLDSLVGLLDAAPKSRKWKLRARVGDKVRWYEEPEDIDHAQAV
jgi:hypothetical protein